MGTSKQTRLDSLNVAIQDAQVNIECAKSEVAQYEFDLRTLSIKRTNLLATMIGSDEYRTRWEKLGQMKLEDKHVK